MSYYATSKIAWHPDRVNALRYGLRVVPVGMQLILSDLCNQDCEWCAYRSSSGLSQALFPDADGNRNPNRMISREKAIEIVQDAAEAGVKSITFTGGGEPTVHPDHLEIFRIAQDLGIETSLNTNAVVLRKGWEEVYRRMTYVRVSLDAGSPEDYAETRGVAAGVYGKVLGNIAKISSVCRPRGCVVGVGFVVSPKNYEKLWSGVQEVSIAGADYARMAYMQSLDGDAAYPGDTLEKCKAAVKECMSLNSERFQVVDLMEQTKSDPYPHDRCWFQEVVTYIGADLTVYRCCYTAYTDKGRAGSLKDQRLSEWLARSAEAYRSFDARACGECPLVHKNEEIRRLVAERPPHVNFI